MKIAVATQDGQKIDDYFNKSLGFVVMTVEDGSVVSREIRDITGTNTLAPVTTQPVQAGIEAPHECKGQKLMSLILDCNVLLSGRMCTGIQSKLQEAEIKPVLTDVVNIGEAVQAYLEGSLENHPEMAHTGD